MKAVTLKQFGSVDNFEVSDLPAPSIGENEVLVKVKAVSINPVDTYIRSGKAFTETFKGEDTVILGWDISGEVAKTGSQVTKFKEGDEVFGMINFPGHAKAYAEYAAALEDHLALKPAGISHEDAAAATLAALTAWQALVHKANVSEGDKVLILGASGGVGHYAVQIAKHFGAYVIGSSSAPNRDFVLKMGADEHIDYKSERFEERVTDADIVLDGVGGESSYRALEATKEGGHVITLVGKATDLPDKAAQQNKKGDINLVTPSAKDMQQIAALMEEGAVTSHIFRSYPYDRMGEAHRQVETLHTVGKVVVTF